MSLKRYEVSIIDRSIDGFNFILGISIHPKDAENDFLEINFYFLFLLLHIKIFY
tara:strand:- start:905 stop:1066 length:162 start_codon:yes stop_codon:yes gene_type:complete